MGTATERTHRNALKFGASGEVDAKEGVATAQGMDIAQSNCSEVLSPQIELYGAIGEALMLQPLLQ